jgi:dTDP-glucose 4,6-dehydratase
LQGQNVFFTGGSGFVGSWLLESLLHADTVLALGVRATVLTRSAGRMAAKLPHLANDPRVEMIEGDVRQWVGEGRHRNCRYLVHAAGDASAALNRDEPLVMVDTIVEGTRRTLEYARASGTRRVLMLSSGGVYGKVPLSIGKVPEEYTGGPDPMDPYYAYAEAKRMAELLCAVYAKQYGMGIPVARLFAFVGPRLPLDAHFAAGNFIRDALQGAEIVIDGDGTAVRSYLYAADLAVWLWTVLLRGKSGRAYNVGSDEGVSIRQLADTTASVFAGGRPVKVCGRINASNPINRYVPDIARARESLGLGVWTPLREALSRTVDWLTVSAS